MDAAAPHILLPLGGGETADEDHHGPQVTLAERGLRHRAPPSLDLPEERTVGLRLYPRRSKVPRALRQRHGLRSVAAAGASIGAAIGALGAPSTATTIETSSGVPLTVAAAEVTRSMKWPEIQPRTNSLGTSTSSISAVRLRALARPNHALYVGGARVCCSSSETADQSVEADVSGVADVIAEAATVAGNAREMKVGNRLGSPLFAGKTNDSQGYPQSYPPPGRTAGAWLE